MLTIKRKEILSMEGNALFFYCETDSSDYYLEIEGSYEITPRITVPNDFIVRLEKGAEFNELFDACFDECLEALFEFWEYEIAGYDDNGNQLFEDEWWDYWKNKKKKILDIINAVAKADNYKYMVFAVCEDCLDGDPPNIYLDSAVVDFKKNKIYKDFKKYLTDDYFKGIHKRPFVAPFPNITKQTLKDILDKYK